MKVLHTALFSKPYSVRVRLVLFLVTAIFLIMFISSTAIIGLNSTYQSLSNLRDRSLNQMLSSMTLGVKTAQISTYATRLTQTTNALEYQVESQILAQQAEQLHALLEQLKQTTDAENQQFNQMQQYINLLEKSIQDLLLQTHKRHIIHTNILSYLNQSLLHIRHIKRLQKSTALSIAFTSQLAKLEQLIEDATTNPFLDPVFIEIQQHFYQLPQGESDVLIHEELQKLAQQFPYLIESSQNLAAINLRIKFLTFQIEALVKNIDQQYTALAKEKVETVNTASAQIQQRLSKQTSAIIAFSLFTILLILFLSHYIYSLIGKRLYSITNALKRLAQGDKNVTVPQQQTQDEIGDLARSFDIFHQNVLKLEHTDNLLKEKSELLTHTFSAMRDGLAIFDHQDQLISYNTQFKQLLARYFQDYPTLTLASLCEFFIQQQVKIISEEQQLDLALLKKIRQSQDLLELEYQQQILEWRVSPLQEGLVVSLIDRTQRKKLEQDLAHNQKMRAIGHLTGGIAHDFNNFLAVIIGNLDLIDSSQLNERQAKRLQRALKAAENSATLTQRLLAYARKQPLHPTALNINQLVQDIYDLMKHSIPPTIQVRLNFSENLSAVYIDKNQLETALVNLIVNAKDAIEGEGQIILETKELMVQRTHHLEKMVQLSIIDNGCGMDEATQKRIFEPFFTTKKNGRGSGLGLSMVYGFIRQSKGRIVVKSQLNQGSNIQLQLPIIDNRPTEQSQQATTFLMTKKATLLLVEDKLALQETLAEQLKDMGFNTILCSSGEQAIDYLAQSQHIDYLLSDIVLSGKLTGIDVANYAHQHHPKIHILLMTGHTEQTDKASKYPLLIKPFKQQDLQQALAKL